MVPSDREIICEAGALVAVKWVSGDAARLSEWWSADRRDLFFTSASLPFPCTAEAFRAYHDKNYKTGSHELFSVLSRETGEHVGHFEVKNISQELKNGTLAHVYLGKAFRGRGYGKALNALMCRVVFERLGLYRLGLAVHATNRTAVAFYVRGGFTFEGIVRDVIPGENGCRYSLYQMSLLKPEWDGGLKS